MVQGRPEEQGPLEGLHPADAEALETLVHAGFRAEAIDGSTPPDVRVRAEHLVRLLGLLSTGALADPALEDVTFARVLRARRETLGATSLEPELCVDDEEAFDAWVMAGYESSRVTASLRARAQRHEHLAALVAGNTSGGPAGDDSLLDRTLAAVQAEIDKQEDSLALEPARRRGGLRLADIVSIAAVLLIGSAVLFPVMTAVREQGRRTVCNDNLYAAAMAMGAYSSSHRDSLPMVAASLGGGRWWDVGQPDHSNSANLFTLARTGYVDLANLACPGNPEAPTSLVSKEARDWRRLSEISYSYQIMFGPERPAWNRGRRAVVLTDRSPAVLRAVRGELVNPLANAPNHRGTGQHVLFNDGSTLWLRTPVLENGDNLWLPRAIEIRLDQMAGRVVPLSGTEIPDAADDAFVGP